MEDQRIKDWQFPSQERDGYYKKGWVDELIQTGDRWLRSQKSISTANEDVAMLMGEQNNLVESNTLQTDVRTFVETVADLREIATFGSNAAQLKSQLETYNRAMKYIYWDSNFVQDTRKAIQYSMLGRGYNWVKVSRTNYGRGKLKVMFPALGPLEVLPEQLPSNNDIQGCYAVTIIVPMPIAEAHARFPQQYHQYLTPISRYDWKSYGTLGMARRMDFYSRWRFGDDNNDWDNHYCEIRYTFGRDMRVNDTGRKWDFDLGTPWGYEVPSFGDLIVSTNPFNGLPESRKATMEDCYLYPQLRLMITSPSCPVPLRDSCAFDWHGEIPVVQRDVNDWAWSPLGWSLIKQVSGLERARRELVSKMHEVAMVNLDPPLGYDLHTGVAQTSLQKLDLLRSSGFRVGVNGKPGESLRSILPESMVVGSEQFKQLEVLMQTTQKTLGTTDVQSMKEMKMNISTEEFEKIIQSLGPIGKGLATNNWWANGKIAYMLKYDIPQYFRVADLMGMIGPDAVSMQTFDNDPHSLVPSHLPGEAEGEESKHSKRERAKWFVEQIAMVSQPDQLLNWTQTQERMLYMFFLQKGVPIPMSVIMEKLGVKNYSGTAEGDTLYDQWKNEQIQNLIFKLHAELAVAKEAAKLGIQPQPQPQPGPGQGKGGGRPNSGKNPPKLEKKGGKGGEQRTVISTSK